MKKSMYIIIFLLIVLLIIGIFPNTVNASSKIEFSENMKVSSKTPDDIINGGKNFVEKGQEGNDNLIPKEKTEVITTMIYNVLLITAIVVAIIVGLILGIKFIIGSIEQQAEIKKALVPYVAGCVVVFGAFTIWKIVVNVLQSV